MAITPIGPNDLSGVWQGMIQQETTAETAPMSEYIEQQIGHNLNYLKQKQDAINTTISNLQSKGPLTQVLTAVSYNGSSAHLTIATSPNGKNYVGGILSTYWIAGGPSLVILTNVIVTPNVFSSSWDNGFGSFFSFSLLNNELVGHGSTIFTRKISGVLFYER